MTDDAEIAGHIARVTPRVPPELGERGRKAWRFHIKTYKFTALELTILASVCSGMDEEAVLEADFRAASSPDQRRLIGSALSAHRRSIAAGIRSLALPDLETGETTRSQKLSEAGHKRWGT